MKKNKTKKIYDIIFNESHLWSSGKLEKIVEEHTTNKDKIKNIINQRLKFSYLRNHFEVHSVRIESHDVIEVEGRVFVSQDTKYLG